MLRNSLILLFAFITVAATAQSPWSKTTFDKFSSRSDQEVMTLPSEFDSYNLDVESLKSILQDAPLEDLSNSKAEGLRVELPLPGGEMVTFQVFNSPVMAPGLASRYPSIQSYKGYNVDNPSMSVRFDVGSYGFHAAIHDNENIHYIDPYATGNIEQYITYDVQNHISQLAFDVPFCGAIDNLKDTHFDDALESRGAGDLIPMRQYRFAVSCTGEWGAQRVTVENTLADINTTVNRLNQIFENENSMRLVLVEDNDQLLYFDKDTDPFTNTANGGAMLSTNTAVINSIIGSDGYDLGHVYSVNCNVGGIAALGSMCNANKGAGVTCHYSGSLDYMAAFVTSHEIGHQMSAQHTFNHCDGENESLGNGFEPGSGSTIMSYGGLCGPALNVTNNGAMGNDYYHVASLMQVYNHTRNSGPADICAEKIETDNQEPEIIIDLENDFYIPEETYFYLEGKATDGNEEDQLTYCWEQFNAGPLSPLGEPIANAPHFRSLPPVAEPIRYFPSTDNIIGGTFDRTEVAFAGDRDVNFILTVRDNHIGGGTAVWQEVKFKVKSTPEKFGITSQNSLTTTFVGDELDVEWNVAGTDEAPFNDTEVDILFSLAENPGEFDIHNMVLLAEGIPNNGSATVQMPNHITNKGRLIIRPVGTNYFSINGRNIRIQEPETPSIYFDASPLTQAVCLPGVPTVDISTEGLGGLTGDVTLSVLDGLPAGAVATFDPSVVAPGETSTMVVDFENAPNSAVYKVNIQAVVADVDTFIRPVNYIVTDTDHTDLFGMEPVNGASGVGVAPIFTWNASPNAQLYTVEVSTTPDFSDIILTEEGTDDLDFEPSSLLEKSTVYYWRVIPINDCGEGIPTEVYAFATEALACNRFVPAVDVLPIVITHSGTPTIEASIDISLEGNVADVNVTQFMGLHERNKDLIATIISPQGTEVDLFRKICEQSNFNCQFDDASNIAVKCPLNNLSTYRPKEMLSIFNGEPANGTWTLRLDDTQAGNSGELQSFELEICSNVVLDNPFIVRNNRLLMPPAATRTIQSDRLKVEDNNNLPSELIYTIVELPSRGELVMGGMPVTVGMQFSQAGLNTAGFEYTSDSEDEYYETSFAFTVIDGEGGWIGITDFDITVDPVNSISDPALEREVSIYPVPARELLTVDLSTASEKFTTLNMVDIQGKMVINSQNISSDIITLNVADLPAGVYILNLMNENYSVPKRIVVK